MRCVTLIINTPHHLSHVLSAVNFNEAQKLRLTVLGFTKAQVAHLEVLLGNLPSDIAMNSIETDIGNHNTPEQIIQTVLDVNQEIDNIDANQYFNGAESPTSVVPGNNGGKRRKSRKQRGHKQRGGARYGTGVGANNFDPNNSIYNTQELNLFPYKPN